MKRYLYLVCLLLLPLLSQAQRFNREYFNSNYPFYFISIAAIPDGSYFVTGAGNISASIPLTLRPIAARLDATGNIQSYRDDFDTFHFRYTFDITYLNGTIYGAGSINDATLNERGLLTRFNLDGDTLFTKEFDIDTNSESFSNIVYDSIAHRLYLGGYTRSIDPDLSIGWIVCTDTLGNEIWRKSIPYDPSHRAHTQINNGIMAIGGGSVWTGTLEGNDWDIFALQMDSMGNILFQQKYEGGLNQNDWGGNAVQTNDGFYIVGVRGIDRSPPESQGWLFKIDNQGNKQWERFWGEDSLYGKGFYNGYRHKNNQLILVGYNQKLKEGFSSNNVVFFDEPTRQFTDNREYYPPQSPAKMQDGIWGYAATYDGGLITVGIPDTNPMHAWVIKADSNGCIELPGCYPLGTPALPQWSNNSTALEQNIPNPATATTTIRYQLPKGENGTLGLYNMQGVQLRQYDLKPGSSILEMPLNGLPPGVYLYTLSSNDKPLASRRMIVQ